MNEKEKILKDMFDFGHSVSEKQYTKKIGADNDLGR